jgi:hypothetical protein
VSRRRVTVEIFAIHAIDTSVNGNFLPLLKTAFISIVLSTLDKTKSSPDYIEIRRIFYIFKIMEYIWFYGDIPNNIGADFLVYINLEATETNLPKEIWQLFDLDGSVLEFLCARLSVPAGLDDKYEEFSISLLDIGIPPAR